MEDKDFKKNLKAKKCCVCGGKLSFIETTVGGKKLYGCSLCHLVYWLNS